VETLKPEDPQERLRELQEGLDFIGQKRAGQKSSFEPVESRRSREEDLLRNLGKTNRIECK